MHTPECQDGIDWWPEGAVELNLSTFPASGLLTDSLRLEGLGQWLGIWGTFAGARIAYSPTQSFMLQNGSAIPYPTRKNGEPIDLFLSVDVGASGTMGIGRFKTREAALAWVGTRSSGRSIIVPSGGADADTIVGPFTPAIAGTQLSGGVLAVGGATADCTAIVSGDQSSVIAGVALGTTQAQAANLFGAGGGTPVYAAGQVTIAVPIGGKLFAASASGTEVVYLVVRV